MYVLGVDPGVTTGVALLNGSGDIVWAHDDPFPFYGLKGALVAYPEARVIAELMPVGSGHEREAFTTVEGILSKQARSQVVWIRPAEWKPHPASQVPETGYSKHCKDAVGIARFELFRTNERTI